MLCKVLITSKPTVRKIRTIAQYGKKVLQIEPTRRIGLMPDVKESNITNAKKLIGRNNIPTTNKIQNNVSVCWTDK